MFHDQELHDHNAFHNATHDLVKQQQNTLDQQLTASISPKI
jgi:hypothetical protein